MTALLVDDLAQFIRLVDGGNTMFPAALGRQIGWHLADESDIKNMGARTAFVESVIDFVERTNPDKRIGAGRLAELIVAEFKLNEEG